GRCPVPRGLGRCPCPRSRTDPSPRSGETGRLTSGTCLRVALQGQGRGSRLRRLPSCNCLDTGVELNCVASCFWGNCRVVVGNVLGKHCLVVDQAGDKIVRDPGFRDRWPAAHAGRAKLEMRAGAPELGNWSLLEVGERGEHILETEDRRLSYPREDVDSLARPGPDIDCVFVHAEAEL